MSKQLSFEEGIEHFCDEILEDMRSISMSTTKADMIAHMQHWRELVQTIKFINDGIIR